MNSIPADGSKPWRKQPESQPAQEGEGAAGEVIGAAVDGVATVGEAAAEVVGGVAEGVAEAAGGCLGGLAEGCGGCSLVVLVALAATAQTASAVWR